MALGLNWHVRTAAWMTCLSCVLSTSIAAVYSDGPILSSVSNYFTNWNFYSNFDFNLDIVCHTLPGVTCNDALQVVGWDLSNLGLTGTLSSDIGNLAYIQTLRLNGNALTGPLPLQLARLQTLTHLDLGNNKFQNFLPAILASLPNLTFLNVAYNNFTGSIPPPLQTKFCQDRFVGNPFEKGADASAFPPCIAPPVFVPYTAPTDPTSRAGILAPILGGAIGGGGLSLVLLLILLLVFRWRGRLGDFKFTALTDKDISELEAKFAGTSLQSIHRYSSEEMRIATNEFDESNRLGEGGSAIVYKGQLGGSAQMVAIKRFKETRIGSAEMVEFLGEVDLMARMVHRNILSIVGLCVEKGQMMIVMPYITNGSLLTHLPARRASKMAQPLPLTIRKDIALGVAAGLNYLHTDCSSTVIHRDVKAANVLLDHNFRPVVCDFGLAAVVEEGRISVKDAVKGTFGYMAPEFVQTGLTSTKSDVYGFGVFLLELLTGKEVSKLVADMTEGETLYEWVMAVADENRMAQIIDIELRFMDVDAIDGEDKSEVLNFMFQVAFVCLSENPDERPTMAECYHYIQGESIMDKYKDREADVGKGLSSGFLSHASSRYDSSRGNPRQASATTEISVVGLGILGAS